MFTLIDGEEFLLHRACQAEWLPCPPVVVVARDEAGVVEFFDGPGRREAANRADALEGR